MTATEAVADVVEDLEQRSGREIAILRAAYRVMARDGAHNLRLQAVADEAGVSKGLVLYHFGRKSDVVQRAMQWALLRTAAHVRRSMRAANDDVLAAVVDAIFPSPTSNRDFVLVYLDLVAAAAHDSAYATLRVVLRDIADGLYESVVTTAIERGELPPMDAARAGRHVRVIVDGTLLTWLQDDDWAHHHDEAKQLCLSMLRTQLAEVAPATA